MGPEGVFGPPSGPGVRKIFVRSPAGAASIRHRAHGAGPNLYSYQIPTLLSEVKTDRYFPPIGPPDGRTEIGRHGGPGAQPGRSWSLRSSKRKPADPTFGPRKLFGRETFSGLAWGRIWGRYRVFGRNWTVWDPQEHPTRKPKNRRSAIAMP